MSALELGPNEFIDQICSRDHRPCVITTQRHRSRDLFTALASQAPREGIAKNGIGPLRLLCSVDRHPSCGIRDVADQWFGL
jgi:hypothetical protein